MDEKPLPVTDSVFFPYYVNQNRLLDIYAILNRGFSEYEEIKEESSSGKSSSKRRGAGVGFKIFKLGITAEAELDKNSGNSSSKESKLVQTTTSMLSMVVEQLSQHKFLKEILMSQPGDFVCIPVNLKINSIKGLVDEAIEITELSQKMQEVGGTKLKGSNNANSASLKKNRSCHQRVIFRRRDSFGKRTLCRNWYDNRPKSISRYSAGYYRY